jgi:hypothetical protein
MRNTLILLILTFHSSLSVKHGIKKSQSVLEKTKDALSPDAIAAGLNVTAPAPAAVTQMGL